MVPSLRSRQMHGRVARAAKIDERVDQLAEGRMAAAGDGAAEPIEHTALTSVNGSLIKIGKLRFRQKFCEGTGDPEMQIRGAVLEHLLFPSIRSARPCRATIADAWTTTYLQAKFFCSRP